MPGPSEDALERLFAEAQRNLEQQNHAADRLDTKASEVLRFNAILVGVLVTGLSVAAQLGPVPGASPFPVGGFVAGAVLLLASTMIAIRAFHETGYRVGLQSEELEDVLKRDVGDRELVEEILPAYVGGIAQNRRSLDRVSARMNWALLTLLAALGLLVASTTTLML